MSEGQLNWMPALHVFPMAAIKMSAVATDTGVNSRINYERICLLAHSQVVDRIQSLLACGTKGLGSSMAGGERSFPVSCHLGLTIEQLPTEQMHFLRANQPAN